MNEEEIIHSVDKRDLVSPVLAPDDQAIEEERQRRLAAEAEDVRSLRGHGAVVLTKEQLETKRQKEARVEEEFLRLKGIKKGHIGAKIVEIHPNQPDKKEMQAG